MILRNLKLFLQNVWKNRLLTDIILENKKEFDIIFIQEFLWSFIWTNPNLTSKKGDRIVGTSNYLSWIIFSRQSTHDKDHPKAIMYINVWLTQFWFSLRKDVLNHRNINLISFFNNGIIFFIINIYLDEYQI